MNSQDPNKNYLNNRRMLNRFFSKSSGEGTVLYCDLNKYIKYFSISTRNCFVVVFFGYDSRLLSFGAKL